MVAQVIPVQLSCRTMRLLVTIASAALFGVTLCDPIRLTSFEETTGDIVSAARNYFNGFQVCIVNNGDTNIIGDAGIKFWNILGSNAIFHGTSDMYYSKVKVKCELFIISMNNLQIEKFSKDMETLSGSPSRKSNSLFVFLTNKPLADSFILAYVSELYWYGIVKSLLIHHNYETNTVKIIACDYFSKTTHDINNFRNLEEYLEVDPLRNLNGYPLKSASSLAIPYLQSNGKEMSGPCASFVQVAARKWNATETWVEIPMEEYSFDGIDSLFATKKLSLLFLTLFVSNHAHYVSVPRIRSECFLIPESRIGSYFYFLMEPFSWEVWILVLLVFCLCLLLNLILPRIFPRNLLFSIIFEHHSTSQTETNLIERLTSFVLTLFVFFLTESCQALMMYFMLNNKFNPRLKTLDQLIESGLKIKLHQNILKAFQHVYPKLANIAFSTSKAGPLDNQHVVFASCDLAHLFVQSDGNIDPWSKDPLFYVLEERMLGLPTHHTVSRYEPFEERIRLIHNRFIETGIWDHWIRQSDRQYTRKTYQLIVNELSYDDIISLWFILAYGLAVGGVIFIGEWIWPKRYRLKLWITNNVMQLKVKRWQRRARKNHVGANPLY